MYFEFDFMRRIVRWKQTQEFTEERDAQPVLADGCLLLSAESWQSWGTSNAEFYSVMASLVLF